MSLKTETSLHWFHTLNTMKIALSDEQYTRVLECFWSSQLRSKLWLIEQLEKHHLLGALSNVPVYVYGGWYGVLAQMLYDKTNGFIISVDIDPECETIGNWLSPDVDFHTEDMTIHRPVSPHAVSINTSSEHITQEQYDQWIANRPSGSLVVVQGNNFFNNPEHVRCHQTLTDFMKSSGLTNIVYAGSLDCVDFNRFMVIGFK